MANLVFHGSSPVATLKGTGVNRQNIAKTPIHPREMSPWAFLILAAHCTEEEIEQIHNVFRQFKTRPKGFKDRQILYARVTNRYPLFGAGQINRAMTHQIWCSDMGWRKDLEWRITDARRRIEAFDTPVPPP